MAKNRKVDPEVVKAILRSLLKHRTSLCEKRHSQSMILDTESNLKKRSLEQLAEMQGNLKGTHNAILSLELHINTVLDLVLPPDQRFDMRKNTHKEVITYAKEYSGYNR